MLWCPSPNGPRLGRALSKLPHRVNRAQQNSMDLLHCNAAVNTGLLQRTHICDLKGLTNSTTPDSVSVHRNLSHFPRSTLAHSAISLLHGTSAEEKFTIVLFLLLHTRTAVRPAGAAEVGRQVNFPSISTSEAGPHGITCPLCAISSHVLDDRWRLGG